MAKSKLELLAYFVADEDIGKLLVEEEPEFNTSLIVGTLQALKDKVISQKRFNVIKNNITKVQNSHYKQILDSKNQNLSKAWNELGIEGTVNIGQLIPLGVYKNDGNTICISNFAKIDFNELVGYVQNIAECYLRLKKRVLVVSAIKVYDTSEKMDLSWAKSKAEKFASTIISSNNVIKPKISKENGKKVYDSTCYICHSSGVAGAPKFGNKKVWAARISLGVESLYSSAMKGKGAMPAKGGISTLSDKEVKAAVDYMVSESK